MSLQAWLASVGGDAWKSWRILAVWPWPAVCIGYPGSKITWSDYNFFRKEIRPGDMILTRSEKYFLSNRGIAGTAFKHLAVYVGAVRGNRDQETHFIHRAQFLGLKYIPDTKHLPGVFDRTVVHAISEGVVCQDLGEVCFHADYVCVFRPWTTQEQQLSIVQVALSQQGKAYNFDFKSLGHPALYCTELGEFCLQAAGIAPPDRVSRNVNWKGCVLPLKRWKAPVFLADAFALRFPVIGFSDSCDNRGFWGGSLDAEAMRSKILFTASTQDREIRLDGPVLPI